ncbi:MAG: phosphatase PAP2 family protein [Clostridia bacterium]|nr:phosphatase PAP2 family protein [Clostridia bacterium]
MYFPAATLVHAVNYRPVLIGGYLEASYPSSTTLLVLCVMPTAILQLKTRIRNRGFRRFVTWGITAFMVFMVVGRLISGVHWLTDIIGGVLLSGGLVMTYAAVCAAKEEN